ncbi:MAG TPA: hypothetical protein VIL26_03875 [Clostridia bacterium]
MNNLDFTKKLIRLRIATRRICSLEDKEKKLISLKTKILFLLYLYGEMTPNQIIDILKISKPNLTVLGHQLQEEKLIQKTSLADKRNIIYKITDEGKLNMEAKLDKISVTTNDKKVLDAIDTVLDFLENIQ